MIIVKLQGGFGNQLFQYAAGYNLSQIHQTKLKFDKTAFNDYKLRFIELEKLNIPLEFASTKEINELKCTSIFERLRNSVVPLSKRKEYKEKFFHYNETFFKLGSNVYLSGYFQSEKYFINIKEEIQSQFNLTSLKNKVDINILNDINSSNSISIHVRLTDYASLINREYHGLLAEDYYLSAINYLSNIHKDSKFYIFSDDINQAKNLLIKNGTSNIKAIETGNPLHDFYLMSQCKHNIIANSSFSWWAAWLNPNLYKIVIAPKKWFNKGPQDTQDLFPPSWITI